jgi:hypothetical protein
MTTTLPQPRQSIYQLSDNLRDETPIFGVRTAVSSEGEGEREELLLSKLGAKGWGRLHHFRHYYSAGWGDGSSKPLSPRALEAFYRFLEAAQFPQGSVPSVFLTDEGSIELCWEDQGGRALQLEFRPSDIELYIEADELEDSVPVSEAKALASRLRA